MHKFPKNGKMENWFSGNFQLFQANIMKIRLICVFFQGACDGNVKTHRNIARFESPTWQSLQKCDFIGILGQKCIKNAIL